MLRGRILLLFAALIIGILVPLNECKPQKNHPSPLFSGADVAVDPTHVAHHHSAVKREDAEAEGGETSTEDPCQAVADAKWAATKAELEQKAQELLEEKEHLKKQASDEATKIQDEAKAEGDKYKDQLVNDAKQKADKIKADAQAKAKETLADAQKKLKDQSDKIKTDAQAKGEETMDDAKKKLCAKAPLTPGCGAAQISGIVLIATVIGYFFVLL